MKKILFLLLICFIKLNAYEYFIFYRNQPTLARSFFYGENSKMYSLFEYNDGRHVVTQVNRDLWNTYYGFFSGIKRSNRTLEQLENTSSGVGYIGKTVFDSYYKNDAIFLNDLYKYFGNVFLNYLYNTNLNFDYYNHINYENYKILYNSDGLAVESFVDGVYAGLYNMDEMQFSGNLYNENGDLVLVNGVEPSYFQILCDKLIGDLHLKMLDAENLIDKGWIFAVVFAFAMFYLIARTLKRVLMGKNNKGVENES